MGKEGEEAKNQLVKLLTNTPVLAYFNDELEVTVQTDASQEGLGAVLLQNDREGLRPISYISRSLTMPRENSIAMNYSVWLWCGH